MEIWWTATFPNILALICFTVSEKTRFMDGRRTTDACVMAIALLTQSSRAKNEFERTNLIKKPIRTSEYSVLATQNRHLEFVLGNECTSQLGEPFDCAELDTGCQSGIYTIYLQGKSQSVFCDMETDSGGWTVRTWLSVLLYSKMNIPCMVNNILRSCALLSKAGHSKCLNEKRPLPPPPTHTSWYMGTMTIMSSLAARWLTVLLHFDFAGKSVWG